MQKQNKKRASGRNALLLICLLFTAASLPAASITWTFDTGAATCPGGGNCNGEAVFTYTPGTQSFTITLNNLLTDVKDAAQLVTDVQFTTPLAGISLTDSSGIPISLNTSPGTPMPGPAITTGWNAGSIGTNTWLLCVICTGGVSASATPSEGIIPVESSYSDANGSITNSGSHNPLLESGATFTFSTTSVLPNDTSTDPFSDVSISFGTTFGELSTGGFVGTPEPLSPMLTGAGLIIVGLTRRRRKTNKA